MRSTMRLMLAASLTLLLPGCALLGGGRPLVVAQATPCAKLVPASWSTDGVAHTPDPTQAETKPLDLSGQLVWTLGELKKWASFGVSESQKVDDANGRTHDAMQIVADCEARDAAAVKAAKPKFLGLF